MLKDLTPAQQAAIYLHVVGGFNDWAELFQIAEGKERYNKLTDKSKRQTVSLFRRSEKILEGIQDLKYKLGLKEKAIREDERNRAGETEPTKSAAEVEATNFLNLDEFLQYANQQANNVTDEKERRAWVELIGKYMSFKDRSEAEEVEIKRFYTPLECEKCEIYNKCRLCNLAECHKIDK